MSDDTPDVVPTSETEVVEDMDVDLDGDGTPDGHVTIEVERIDVDGDGIPDIAEVEVLDFSEIPEPAGE